MSQNPGVLESWVEPLIILSQSYAVGGLSLESACRVSYFRGKIVQDFAKISTFPGAMMSVNLSETSMNAYFQRADLQDLSGRVTIACINSPDNVTVSGDEALIDVLQSALNSDQIFARKLSTGMAYHSPRMQVIAHEYRSSMQDLSKARIPTRHTLMISSSTGGEVTDIDALSSADYWVSNLVEPVRFSEAMSRLVSKSQASTPKKLGRVHRDTIYDILEIGPHSTLKVPIGQILRAEISRKGIRYHSVLSRYKPSAAAMMNVTGHLYSLGYPIRLHEINQTTTSSFSSTKPLVDLPEYPFSQDRTYWHESRLSRDVKLRQHPRLELLGTSMAESNALEARWRKLFDIAETPWIDEHKVKSNVSLCANSIH